MEDACRQAEIAYEEVAKEWEKSLEDANRLIDDSMKPQAPDSSLQIAKIDRKSLKSELQKLKELYKGGGIILAAVDGVVTEIHIEAGNDTIDGKNIAIADTSTGSRFQAQITKRTEEVHIKGGSGGSGAGWGSGCSKRPEGGFGESGQRESGALECNGYVT